MAVPQVMIELTSSHSSLSGLDLGTRRTFQGKSYVLVEVNTGITVVAGNALYYTGTANKVTTTAAKNTFAGIAQCGAAEGTYIWIQDKGMFSGVTHGGSIISGTVIIAGANTKLACYATAGVALTERPLGVWLAAAATAGVTAYGYLH